MGAFGKVSWKVTTVVISVPVWFAVRKGLDKAWHKARPHKPPRHPDDPDVTWQDALAWGALSGLATAAARVATTKGAAKAWRTFTGSEPPPKFEKLQAEEAARDENKADQEA